MRLGTAFVAPAARAFLADRPGACLPGAEFGTHNFNNWLLDRVLQDQRWDPGTHTFRPGTDAAWSNDDPRLMMHARLLEESAGGGPSAAQPRL